jgi:uncharacterized protein (TIGR03663 family)
MNRPALMAALMVLAVLGGAWLRLAHLGARPIHHDEAVQAVKLGELLESGRYVYDPREYHGPALNYLSLPIVRLAGARRLVDVTETQLRLLPALCGIGLVALIWLLRDGLGRAGALWAAALTAVSPALVYYSRDYIAEMLLVLFSFGAIVGGWRYLHGGTRGRFGWLVLAGASVGMMHASKETFVIALFAMAVAAALALALSNQGFRAPLARSLPALGAALAIGAVVSVLLFSSFLSNARGPLDSVATYAVYLGRASGRQDASWHVHPWWYYLGVLLWQGGAAWTQAPVLALALVGCVAAAARRGLGEADASLVRFLGIYALVLLVIYSVLPYKTPWCVLGALQAMLLLGGVGAGVVLRAVRGRAVVVGLLLVVLVWMACQAWRASLVAYADTANPYAYVQTTDDVPALARRLEQVAGPALPIQVICPGNDYWPLPWYLRGRAHVGWLAEVPEGPLAPVLVVKPEAEAALAGKLFAPSAAGGRLYVPLDGPHGGRDWLLRPNVPLRVYVRLDVWEERAN